MGDGRAVLARRPDGSADAVLVDAFVGVRVPRHLVTLEALVDLARVARLAAVNVVDAKAMADASAIAAGLQAAFPHTIALGASSALAKAARWQCRRSSARMRRCRWSACAHERAADREPAALLEPGEMGAFVGGAPPWRD